MNGAPIVTGCPACGTRFRVHAAQLNTAGGRVRCGACLEVFDARRFAVATETPAAGAVVQPETNAADMTSDSIVSGVPANAPGLDDAASEAEELLGEAHPPATVVREGTVEAVHANDAPPRHRFTVLDANAEVAPAPDPVRRHRPVLESDLEPGLTLDQRSQFEILAGSLDEPSAPPPQRSWRAILISLGVLLLVGGQALYFEADRWASVSAVRPLYNGICFVLGCTVPEYSDPKAMRSENVVLRPHPERSDVLLIDAQIVNTAPYPQAFPNLRVDLLDRAGQVISTRLFEPADYRGGELATMPDVPPDRALQVSLEVYRPRVSVVHFRFELLPVSQH